ncbi:MAG: bacteriorhodopsin [Nostoc sp.]|uniref:bacteriorhodopsin n=1 Tax=Nostoc sp. TaxID=1180 RepID=UPI002FF8DC78
MTATPTKTQPTPAVPAHRATGASIAGLALVCLTLDVDVIAKVDAMTPIAISFRKLVTVHLVLWTLYPIVWILSPEGFNALGQGGETMGYTLLDIASKVGFGFLSLNTLHNLEQAGESITESEPLYE